VAAVCCGIWGTHRSKLLWGAARGLLSCQLEQPQHQCPVCHKTLCAFWGVCFVCLPWQGFLTAACLCVCGTLQVGGHS
jgi:hypothetical protein